VNANYLSSGRDYNDGGRDYGDRGGYYDDYDSYDDYDDGPDFVIVQPRSRVHYWPRYQNRACVGGPNARFCITD